MTIHAEFARAADQWRERQVLHVTGGTAAAYGIAAGGISYAALRSSADDWARRLDGAGLGEGMRIAVLLENRPAYFALWIAANRLGASVVPINPDLRRAELTYLFGHAEPALILTVPGRLDDLRAVVAAMGLDVPVAVEGQPLPAVRGNSVVAALTDDDDRREAAVLYTSGTTGLPKGCVLTNRYFLRAGEWYARLDGLAGLSPDRGERMITPLPVFHMNAMAYSFMAMVKVGGCLIVLDRFHPKTWWADVRDSGATCLHYLGVMPSMLMQLAPAGTDRAHSARFGFGAGVDPKIQAAFETRFNLPLVEAWAMTETGAGAVIAANGVDRLIGQSCLGRPGPDVAVEVLDDTGQPCAADQPGELCVRAAGEDPRDGFFQHYYKDPEATAAAWAEGWFHTGDIVRRDSAGRFYFVDRKKNVIRRSGENIAAVEVESVLMRHDAIRGVGVTAVPDALRGDEVFALIVADHAGPALAEDIVAWALDQMAYFKVPGYIAFVDDLPLTGTQKLQRARLKELAMERRSDPATHDLRHLKKRRVPA